MKSFFILVGFVKSLWTIKKQVDKVKYFCIAGGMMLLSCVESEVQYFFDVLG